jgi:DNA-directed RNA polymerase I and III subunit RPAC1
VFSALGFDNAFDLDEFEKNLKIKINHINKEDGELVFELIGVDACIANALRRILISEVCIRPCMPRCPAL